MAPYLYRLPVVLLALLLAATLGSAGSLDARSPQEADDDETTSLHFYTPTPSYSIPSWYTRTSGGIQPTASVSFAFGGMSNTSVCGRCDITWSYTGNTLYTMGIAAMPIELIGTTSDDASPTIVTILNGGLGVGLYSWFPVRVPAGRYVLEVSIPNTSTLYFSEPFWVVDSVDTSCLASVSSDVPSSGTSGTSPSSPASTSSSADDTSGIPAIGAVSDSEPLTSAGIAGVVIGGVIFVGAVIAVLLFLWQRRSNRASGAPRGGLFEKRRPKGAVTITSRGNSFSSYHGRPAPGMGSSFGMGHQYTLNDPSRSDFGHIFLDEDARSQSVNGEKPITHAPFEFGNVPPAVVHRSSHTYRDSFGSIASGSTTAAGSPAVTANHHRPSKHWVNNVSDPFSSGPPTPSPRASGDYQGPPGGQSQVPVALFSPSSVASTPRSYGSPGVPRDISIASSSSPDLTYEQEVSPSSTAVTAPTVPRRAPPAPPIAAGSHQSRRGKPALARKPVPVYEPSISGEVLELVEPSSPRSAAGSMGPYYTNNNVGQHSKSSLGQTSSSGNDWSFAAAQSHCSPSGGSHLSSGSHLSDASHLSLSGLSTRGDMPALNHKSSFGDRQLHVLMPDPPTQEMR